MLFNENGEETFSTTRENYCTTALGSIATKNIKYDDENRKYPIKQKLAIIDELLAAGADPEGDFILQNIHMYSDQPAIIEKIKTAQAAKNS